MPIRPLLRGAVRRAPRATLLAFALAACAASPKKSTAGAPRPRSDIITVEDMRRGQWSNVYDLVANTHPRWLQSRGPDTILGQPGEVQVHMDDSRLGGVNALRNIPVGGISYIEFISPNDAAARWGLNHGHGAIFISTRARR